MTKRLVVLYAGSEGRTLSYQTGWPRALAADARVSARLLDLSTRRGLLGARLLGRPEAIVLLHSVFSNSGYVPEWLIEKISGAGIPTIWFIGNEYKLMPEKMAFAEKLGVDVLVTQIDDPAVRELYRARLRCDVTHIPNTGIDTAIFRPTRPWQERPLDLGYRAYEGPAYLGHDERRRLFDVFSEAARRRGLSADLSIDASQRFTEPEWADFLDRCRGQIGFEAGADFFDLDDSLRLEVEGNEHLSFAELDARFFAGRPRRPGRALSGRIVEAAATKTVQLLIQGRYGGVFEPNVHYIPLRRDLADADEALDRLLDPRSRELAENAYEVALEHFTYTALVGRLLDVVESRV